MKGDRPRRDASRRDEPLRLGLLALGAGVIACAAVAVAAAGEPLRDADGGMGRITVSPWVLLIPVVAAVILIILGLAGLKGVEGTRQGRKKPLWLTVVGLVLLVAVISRFRPDEAAESDRPYTFEGRGGTGSVRARGTRPGRPGWRWPQEARWRRVPSSSAAAPRRSSPRPNRTPPLTRCGRWRRLSPT